MDVPVERQRELIEGQLAALREQLWAAQRDLRSWNRMYATAENQQGLAVSRHWKLQAEETKKPIRAQLIQIEFNIERLEIGIEDCLADLAALAAADDNAPVQLRAVGDNE